MTQQLQLFEIKRIDLEQYQEEVLADDNADRLLEIYEEVTEKGLEPYVVINFFVDTLMVVDFDILWEEQERHGRMTYFQFKIGETEIWCAEREMEIWLNEAQVFVWGEDDVFDAKTMRKIKRKIKSFIANRGQQFDCLIRGKKMQGTK